MKKIGITLVLTCICLCRAVQAQPLDRLAKFDSVDAFIDSLRQLEPQKHPCIYSRAFSIEDFGEGQQDALIVPSKIESVAEIWRSPEYALLFATARPETTASKSEVAVLIIFGHINDAWKLCGLKRYETIGKDAEIKCDLTSYGYKDYLPGQGISPAVVTFTCYSGGRGASESTSWSLIFTNGALYDFK